MKFKRSLSLLTALCLVLLCAFPALAQDFAITGISKYGHLELDVTGGALLDLGFAYGDILEATINGATYDMPLCTNYTDVIAGAALCRAADESQRVLLCINGGNLAQDCGLAVRVETDEEPGYTWEYAVDGPLSASLELKEAGGYLLQWQARHLVRTNDRADYSQLSDAQFANFRAVDTSGMGEGVLYRSASPISTEIGRNAYADAQIAGAGVKTIVNLADSDVQMRAQEGWVGSYYSGCSVLPLNMAMDFTSADFEAKLADGLRFIAQNEGPYLVHCTEGKDRCGFVSAVLECLMGAPAGEIVADYMETYFNYYGVEEGSEQYAIIADENICAMMEAAFEIPDFTAGDVNTAQEVRAYMMEKLGLSAEEIDLLAARLS